MAKDKSFDELLAEVDAGESQDPGNLAVFPDDAPSSGEWVDTHDILAAPTREELAEGKRLGQEIDVEDDDDTGVS